ncbi:hypothetical protein J2Z76_002011 [Sedimentibacter acidaminivorans]|uniref:DUF2812 domain-containing protein n=1 Tax=Sedimentibacter acidaminivorans TaxID=913099 RepID=A0ABS4GET0_9FIRM|nr:DUF2812 domain-containing protein [Sedimentibacter acidaminivorans]MBP1926147.1 hypothetical protein [Sedimentibacter acidaminivorans]
MSDKKKVNWGFSKLEYKLMERYLEEMAMKGWMLEEISSQKAIFTPINPRKIKYCVDIASKTKKSLFKRDSDFDENYNKSCERLGWHFITSYDQIQFFYAENHENTYRIHTDMESEKEFIINTVWKKETYKSLFYLICLIILSVYIFKFNRKILYYLIRSNDGMIFLLIPMTYIMVSYSFISKLIWYFKIESTMSLKASQKHYKFARFRNIISDTFTYILQILSILVLFSSYFSKGLLYNLNIKLSVLAILGFIIISCYIFVRIKEDLNKKWQVVFISSIFIGITILVYYMSSISLDEYAKNPNGIQVIPDKYSVIKISDFINTNKIDRNDFTISYNPLVPTHYKYNEYYSDSYNTYMAGTEYFKCMNKEIATILYNGIISEYKKRTYISAKIENISEKYWNCDKATLIYDDTLLLLKGSEVIEVKISQKLTNIYYEKFRKKILEKFMKVY